MQNRSIQCLSLLLVIVTALLLGCNNTGGFDSAAGIAIGTSSSNAQQQSTDIRHDASVRLVFKLDDNDAGNYRPTIRRSGHGKSEAQVTFRLTGIVVGDAAQRTQVREETVPVASDGSAVLTMDHLGVLPSVAQVHINGGTISGLGDFHGGQDLVSGGNDVVVNPNGSQLKQDVVSSVMENLLTVPDTLRNAPANLVDDIKNTVDSVDRTSTMVNEKALNKYAEHLNPAGLVRLTTASDQTTLQGFTGQTQSWSQPNTSFWQNGDLWSAAPSRVLFVNVLRHGIGGFGLVSCANTTAFQFAVARIDTSTGARAAFCRNRGQCVATQILSDNSIVIGGVSQDRNCPVVFRWAGTTGVANTTSDVESAQGLVWERFLDDFTGSSQDARPSIVSIQADSATGILLCAARDANQQTKYYRIDSSTGTVVGTPLAAASNQVPTVSLTQPSANVSYAPDAIVNITATANDSDGRVTQVAFYANDKAIGIDTTAPFTFQWQGMDPGSYTITARALDNRGGVGVSAGIPITVRAPMLPPVNVVVAPSGSGKVTVTWDAVDGASGYNLYWSTTAGFTKTMATKVTGARSPYLHTGLVNGTTYHYAVTAKNSSEEESALSNEVSATPALAASDRVIAIAAGEKHSLAIKGDGTVWAWGSNAGGQLGDGTTGGSTTGTGILTGTGASSGSATDHTRPTQVTGLIGSATKIFAKYGRSYAVMDDGALWGWGVSPLGDGSSQNRSTPVQIIRLNNVSSLDIGPSHGVAVTSDGSFWSWGNNLQGEVGDGSTQPRYTPVKIAAVGTCMAAGAGYWSSAGVSTNGTVYRWGVRSVPTPATFGLTNIVSVIGGSNLRAYEGFFIATDNDGQLWAWGTNQNGELGDGTTTGYSANPVQVVGLNQVSAVSCHGHVLALRNGEIWSWGYNSYGQLGDGSQSSRNMPGRVAGLTGVQAIAAGGDHSLALKDGIVYSWGSNEYGQLGNGSTVRQLHPIQIQW